MSTFVLKLIAVISMLIDHIGCVFISENSNYYLIFRSIGRLAFPIYAFLIVEGFHHTRDVKKYLARLGIFALISEVPFDLAFYKTVFYPYYQNVFFTLFLGLMLIYLIRIVEEKYSRNPFIYNLLSLLLTMGFCLIASILQTDYDYRGVLLIVAFYLFRQSKLMITACLLIITGMLGGLNMLATVSILFIGFYNGKKGKNIKYIFYIFYPLHLLILYLITLVI